MYSNDIMEDIQKMYGNDDPERLIDLIDRFSMLDDNIKDDKVNSPSHYNSGKFETIEVIEEITKGYEDGFVSYCVGNTLKYLTRAPFKHENVEEDINKAAKYLEFAIEYMNKNESDS